MNVAPTETVYCNWKMKCVIHRAEKELWPLTHGERVDLLADNFPDIPLAEIRLALEKLERLDAQN